jgi:hypothetical protein
LVREPRFSCVTQFFRFLRESPIILVVASAYLLQLGEHVGGFIIS